MIIAGGGIGGLARGAGAGAPGLAVKVLEQAPQLGEIGAGIQLGPNAFAAFDALGIGAIARGRAVYTDEMVMHDALDETLVGRIPTGEAFRERFGNPVRGDPSRRRAPLAARRRAGDRPHRGRDLARRCSASSRTTTASRCSTARGSSHRGLALIGADGVKSAVRRQYVGDEARVSGHVVYRAVVDRKDFPADLQWNAASIWVGPNCHLVHYPLRGGEQYNVVVTFHSREQGGVERARRQPRGSAELLRRHLREGAPADRPAEGLEALGHRRPRADRPVDLRPRRRCSATPRTRRCSTWRRAPAWRWRTRSRWARRCASATTTSASAFALYQRSRVARTARVVLSAREMGRIFHAKGVERLVRNELWKGRTPERFYDAIEWLYGWTVENCLAA